MTKRTPMVWGRTRSPELILIRSGCPNPEARRIATRVREARARIFGEGLRPGAPSDASPESGIAGARARTKGP